MPSRRPTLPDARPGGKARSGYVLAGSVAVLGAA